MSPAARTVTESDCKERLKAQEKINDTLFMKIDQVLEAINGRPGDSRNTGLSGAYIRVGEKLDSLSETAKRMETKLIALESKDVANRLQMLEYERDTMQDDLTKLFEELREARKLPWPKLLIAMMGTTTAALALAGAVFAIMQKIA